MPCRGRRLKKVMRFFGPRMECIPAGKILATPMYRLCRVPKNPATWKPLWTTGEETPTDRMLFQSPNQQQRTGKSSQSSGQILAQIREGGYSTWTSVRQVICISQSWGVGSRSSCTGLWGLALPDLPISPQAAGSETSGGCRHPGSGIKRQRPDLWKISGRT